MTSRRSKRKSNIPDRYILLLFIAIFLIIFGVGLMEFVRSAKLTTGTRQTQGTVVEITGGGKYARIPVVEYQVEGKTYHLEGRFGASLTRLSIGEKVKVLYPPDNPEIGRINAFGEMWAVPLLAGGIGLLGMTALSYAFVKKRHFEKLEFEETKPEELMSEIQRYKLDHKQGG